MTLPRPKLMLQEAEADLLVLIMGIKSMEGRGQSADFNIVGTKISSHGCRSVDWRAIVGNEALQSLLPIEASAKLVHHFKHGLEAQRV